MGAQKNAPKEVLVTLFPHIFHIKPKWNIVCKYLKTKIFSRHSNIIPQMHWTSNIFGYTAAIIGGFWASLNYPILKHLDAALPLNQLTFLHCKWRFVAKARENMLFDLILASFNTEIHFTWLKGYLCYKTILCHKVMLDV